MLIRKLYTAITFANGFLHKMANVMYKFSLCIIIQLNSVMNFDAIVIVLLNIDECLLVESYLINQIIKKTSVDKTMI